MPTSIQIVILLLQLANKIVSWAHDNGLIDQGRRDVISENALAIAAKVSTKDKILEQVNALSDPDVDAALRDLEPK